MKTVVLIGFLLLCGTLAYGFGLSHDFLDSLFGWRIYTILVICFLTDLWKFIKEIQPNAN